MYERLWRRGGERIALIAGLALFLGILGMATVGCGASLNTGYQPEPTPTISSGLPIPTAAPPSYAYLYSRVDYPVQIKVSGSDTVTLNLSLNHDLLSMTPTPTNGTVPATTALPVIPLPTDLQDYGDVAVMADVQHNTGPIVWQLTSADRESLLDGTHQYQSSLMPFTWTVQAVGAGENTGIIELTLIYTYLDGSEHSGATSLTNDPIPMVAVEPTVTNTTLPPFKLPIISLTSLAGIVALLRFLQGIWQAGQNVNDAVKATQAAAALAHKVTHRAPAQQNPMHQQPPTQKRTDRPPTRT